MLDMTVFAGIVIACFVVVSYYWSLWQGGEAVFISAAEAVPVSSLSLPDPQIMQQADTGSFPAGKQHCLACHEGIEPARPLQSGMMQAILAKGASMGDPNGCVVCHGGNPAETINSQRAHSGAPAGSRLTSFTPVPGALQVNDNTCGLCHGDHTYNVSRSNMNTDAGKMKAIMWSWGIGTENHDHVYADHRIDDPDGSTPRFSSDTYKAYMKEMARNFPGQFPDKLEKVPEASLDKLEEMPEQAAFTYLRNCNACHLSNKGMQDRGHYRGMGCAACHSLYSNEGYYEGGDPSIDKKATGHLLVHAMQGTRKSPLTVNGKHLSGIQVSTCASCHSAGRRIGHAYQGLMALDHSDNRGPFDEKGLPQQTNGGYVFKYMRDDAHHRIDKDGKSATGLLCQDCHTTNSMHGNGNIGTTTLATVEIECADCHGTPAKYPWELPIGYGDEFGEKLDMNKARGLADAPMEVTSRFATVYPKQDGYLLTARGNAFGNVVKDGDKVIVHSETGLDFETPLLKQMEKTSAWSDPVKARTAMVAVSKHMEKLECYACHSTWAAQYYGYKYVIDYTKESIDWLDSPEQAAQDGTTADYHKKYVMQPGAPTYGDYSHMRWENPPLGINGEGRVTPLVGVIQTVGTVIGPDGKTLVWNRVAKTAAGYDAIELAPLNPHTTSKASRECADCHGNLQAMGYGTDGGLYDAEPAVARYADVVDASAGNVSHYTRAQISAIKDLHGDFMQLLSSDGRQVQTIDTHWPTSMPLTAGQLECLSRGGTCMACHRDIPDGSIPMKMLGQVAKVANLSFAQADEHAHLLRENNILIAWIKMFAIIGGIIAIPVAIVCILKWKKIVAKIRRIF
ncbi:hypothetical protein [uncultured Parabacteroides sp.]|uniref:hypothetical protein n=1 Tax=uncultured Parabacteroides sp. TaxID=512312 RepID=UPI0028038121|nr:hypothetical protein [uncultured Parabacteroides sp.]